MSIDAPDDHTPAVRTLTPKDLRDAALVTCGHATDVDDARALLDALGLVEQLRTPA